ncbi:hypothetical protein P886_0541 [Alteromonadaceae bacterium 2753L.S.0a.02]|nr:hypothetical protein P886_0541 [Alteromonadaceae bacterium 2753L.S.0a.02]
MTEAAKFDSSIEKSIQATERYYREQIFSSGCSSMVPIYRINAYGTSAEALKQQLNGSPYIQKNVDFSRRVIEALLDVDLYKYQNAHFFFHGDVPKAMESFIELECTKISCISEIIKSETWDRQPDWCNFERNTPELIAKYPVLENLDLNKISKQIFSLVKQVELPETAKLYLAVYTQSEEWKQKFIQNQCSLYFMMEIANQLHLSEHQKKELAILGLIKDVGYTRLSEQISNFEVMHPLISHKLFSEIEYPESEDNLFTEDFISTLALHHEFIDGSGPLGRMRHPLVMKRIEAGIPRISQISGISDLYFGFLSDYSPTLAFSITCGFVLGQGNVRPRYDADVVKVFSSIFGSGNFSSMDVPVDEASNLLEKILGLLNDRSVRDKADHMIKGKSETWYERITLALNIVRNIAFHQPRQLCDRSLMDVLNLPVEFGLRY